MLLYAAGKTAMAAASDPRALLRHASRRRGLRAGHGRNRRRDRRAGAAAGRARVAVAKRIRGALERLGEQSPGLQRYLEATVRTGIFCVYRPDPRRPVDWKLDGGAKWPAARRPIGKKESPCNSE